jgi:hypothetical protein
MRLAFAGRWLVPVAWLDELRVGCQEAAVAEQVAAAVPALRRLIEAAPRAGG